MEINNYNLELEKAVKEIKGKKAKRVIIQLPDGLKPASTEIADKLHEETNAEVMIWFGSCYGACDIPNVDKKDIDLIIQFGHSAWKFK